MRQVEELERQLADGRGRVSVVEKRCAVLELETQEMRERVRHEQKRASALLDSSSTDGGGGSDAAAASAPAGARDTASASSSYSCEQAEPDELSSSAKLFELLEAARRQCELLQGTYTARWP